MKRTQIQLPEELYRRLKQSARGEETTLAEILRRAARYYLALHPDARHETLQWDVPEPEHLGEFLSPEEDWRLLASEDDGSR